jgi:predicted DNA-binding protein (MmcQ/YjbR family)
MDVEWVRKVCLSFPHATETVQWGSDLVFKVAGKMFCVCATEPAKVWLSCKCSEEKFHELVEQEGIIPAPYLARAHWVALENPGALRAAELKPLLREAYDHVVAKLPRRQRDQLAAGRGGGSLT